MSCLNSAKIKKMKAFEVWITDHNYNKITIGHFEDPQIAHKYLDAFINGSGRELPWEYGVTPITIQLKK